MIRHALIGRSVRLPTGGTYSGVTERDGALVAERSDASRGVGGIPHAAVSGLGAAAWLTCARSAVPR